MGDATVSYGTAEVGLTEVDTSRIGLWGAAIGGSYVCYTAAIDARAKCVVSVNGMGDLGRWLKDMRRYWEWKEFVKRLERGRISRVLTGKSEIVQSSEILLRDPATERFVVERGKTHPQLLVRKYSLESADAMASFRPETVVDRISPRAALWICAGEDTLLPIDQSIGMYEKAREPKKLVIFDGEEHHSLYSGKPFERMMTETIEWFGTHLKASF